MVKTSNFYTIANKSWTNANKLRYIYSSGSGWLGNLARNESDMGLRMVYWSPVRNEAADFIWDVGRVTMDAVYLHDDLKDAAGDYGQVSSQLHTKTATTLYN